MTKVTPVYPGKIEINPGYKEEIMSISPDKEKAVESAIGQIERQFCKGSIMKLGDRPIADVPVISTSSLALDKALGIGGLKRQGN